MARIERAAFLSCSALPHFRLNRNSHTRALISGPDGLPNARDLASAAPALIKPCRLYRGTTPAALPEQPNPEALRLLRMANALVDLRSRDERQLDDRAAMVWACGPDFNEREKHIGLLNKRGVILGLSRVLPRHQLRELAYSIVSNPLGARLGVVTRMDKGGLILLNRVLIEAGARSIGRAMNAVTDGVQKGIVYFYCSAGKDRTGLLAALILTVLGVDERSIIFDYARSSEMWLNGPYHIRSEYSTRLEKAGLTPSIWIGSPPEVMEETLVYIKKQFGSVEDYLIRCGFNENRMKQLRNAMRPEG